MKRLLLICTLVIVVSARPESPLGYNYPIPSPAKLYGEPGGNGVVSGLTGNRFELGGARYNFADNANSNSGGVTSEVSYSSKNSYNSAGTYANGEASNLGIGYSPADTANQGASVSSNEYKSGYTSGGSYNSHSSSFSDVNSGVSYQTSGPAIITKDFYFHVAPEDPEEVHPRQQIALPPPQKHYKIIFIKAPNPPKLQVPIIPPQAQNEEKTLVYVLVKKPEEQADIVIPTPPPTKPSKPEVYFIKYNAKKEFVNLPGAEAGASIDARVGANDGTFANGGADVGSVVGVTGVDDNNKGGSGGGHVESDSDSVTINAHHEDTNGGVSSSYSEDHSSGGITVLPVQYLPPNH